MPFARTDIVAAADGNAAMERVLNSMANLHDAVLKQINFDPTTPSSTSPNPPMAATLDVQASNGHFLVTITNPLDGVDQRAGMWRNDPSFDFQQASFGSESLIVQKWVKRRLINTSERGFGRRILHQLESSIDLNWDANSELQTYGPSDKLSYDITDPNTTRFWRVKSKFENSDFGAYIYFEDATVCGIKAVYSGQLASLSAVPNMQLNTTNFATVDSFDAGSSATIRVYGAGGVGTAWDRQVGGDIDPLGPFPAASLTGFAYLTHYFVLYNLTSQAYEVYTDAEFPNTLSDNLRFAGDVTTLGAGAASGAAANANISGGVVVSATITAAGSNYFTPPTVGFSGGSGSGAAATATVDGSGHVIGIVITNGGSGYLSPPTIAITPGGSGGVTGGGGADGSSDGRFSNVG